MNWNDLRYFIAVGETASVLEAARRLRSSASTVTRHVSDLERTVGAKLFHRRQSGYVLTDAGIELLPVAKRVAAEANVFERRAAPLAATAVRPVRVELPELLASYVIVPSLAKHLASDESIRLDIVNDAEVSRIATQASDILVRFSRPDSGGYTVRKIGNLSRAIYASPEYLMQRNLTANTTSFDNHVLIGPLERIEHLPTAHWFRNKTHNQPLHMRLGNLRLQVDAVLAGIGIAALPKFVAEAHGLVQLGPESQTALQTDIWLLRNAETKGISHIDRVLGWIEEAVIGA